MFKLAIHPMEEVGGGAPSLRLTRNTGLRVILTSLILSEVGKATKYSFQLNRPVVASHLLRTVQVRTGSDTKKNEFNRIYQEVYIYISRTDKQLRTDIEIM